MLIVWGVLVASVLGSVHCAAMCGAFACMASSRPRGSAAYHAGRLTSYLLLGLIAGAVGARLDRTGDLLGASHLAAAVAGVLMVMWALGTLATQIGISVPVSLAPEWARRAIGTVLIAARDRSPIGRAYLIGLATTLLPCGWLYTFVVVAAGTGSPLSAASVMLVFWIGTLPMLAVVVAGSSRLLGRFARRLPIATAMIVLVLGILSIFGKLRMPTVHVHQPAMHMSSADVVRR